jgi:hypothetical protein
MSYDNSDYIFKFQNEIKSVKNKKEQLESYFILNFI